MKFLERLFKLIVERALKVDPTLTDHDHNHEHQPHAHPADPDPIPHEHDHRYTKPGHAHKTLARKDHLHPVFDGPSHIHDGYALTEDVDRMALRGHVHGESGAVPARIRVPLDIVVTKTNESPDTTEVFKIKRAMLVAEAFFARHGIDLRVNFRSMAIPADSLTFEDDGMSNTHYRRGGAMLTGYVGIDALTIGPEGNNWVGQVSHKNGPWGAFIVAGAKPEGYVGQTIIHELGHYFMTGDNADHEPGTFMDAVVSQSEAITDQQRAIVQRVAHAEWGY